MLHITADTAALLAQLIVVLVVGSVVEWRRAFEAHTLYDMKIVSGVMLVVGAMLASGSLLTLIEVVNDGGRSFNVPYDVTVFALIQCTPSVFVFLLAISFRWLADALKAGQPRKYKWLLHELGDAFRRAGTTN